MATEAAAAETVRAAAPLSRSSAEGAKGSSSAIGVSATGASASIAAGAGGEDSSASKAGELALGVAAGEAAGAAAEARPTTAMKMRAKTTSFRAIFLLFLYEYCEFIMHRDLFSSSLREEILLI
ncbi:hypothetical protein DCAR_0415743 [Daucus carota subsp. sativus]|uniref:Uncharacterized protein n=1 Tax=Daucus carota subsp. sativus TaxID=79200 RepID=A0A165WQ43_DAUCS|nr:hypothetical protein DCAR_0415743 [Daucus carota subsp. sativus]